MIRPGLATVRSAVAATATGVLIFLCLEPTLGAPFELIDDHTILAVTSAVELAESAEQPVSLEGSVTTDFSSAGRVRPGYWVFHYAQVALLGGDAGAWHTVSVLVALLTGLLLWTGLRRFGVPPEIATLGALAAVLAPSAIVSWIRLGPAEAWGTFLLAVAFAVTPPWRRHRAAGDVLLVVALAGMMTVKETFVLALPALLVLRLLSEDEGGGGLPGEWWDRIRSRPWLYALPLSIGFLVGVASIVAGLAAGEASYGGSSLAAPTAVGVGAVLVQIGARWELLLAPVAAVGVRAVSSTPTGARSRVLAGGVVACILLGVLPQAVVYGTRPFFYAHYWYPVAVFLALATALALAWLARRAAPAAWIVGGVLAVVLATTYARPAHFEAEKYRAKWTAFHRMLDHVAEGAAPGAGVLVTADPHEDFEYTWATRYFLASRRPDLEVHFAPFETGQVVRDAPGAPETYFRRIAAVYRIASVDEACDFPWIIPYRSGWWDRRACSGLEPLEFSVPMRLPSFGSLELFEVPGPSFRLLAASAAAGGERVPEEAGPEGGGGTGQAARAHPERRPAA